MGFEVEFLGVGQKSQSGDAILLRFGDLLSSPPRARVVLVDGGFSDTADDILSHLDKYYGTRHIDLVVSTHPDADHINGLRRLMEHVDQDDLSVGGLWLHRPSRWRKAIMRSLANVAGTDYAKAVGRTLEAGEELEDLAERQGIPIVEPFTGVSFQDSLFVVGPTEEYYSELFEEEAKAAAEESRLMRFLGPARAFLEKVAESWNVETLTDEGVTSPINNSSAVLLFRHAGEHILLTADAGMPALDRVADELEAAGILESAIRLIQVPHHGSRRNVGPSVLDRLLGPRRPVEDDEPGRTAIVSCAKEGTPRHPAKKVTNAFKRRGRKVLATCGGTIRHRKDAPDRGWQPATPLPFYNEVDE